MQEFMEFLTSWNKRTDNFNKMQAGYAVLAIAVFLLAGIVGLIQYNLGQTLLFFALLLALTFVANGVMSAVMRTFVVSKRVDTAQKNRKK